MAYTLQKHTVYTTLPKSYNILNRDNMAVTNVYATGRLNALNKGRKYFDCSNVRIIK